MYQVPFELKESRTLELSQQDSVVYVVILTKNPKCDILITHKSLHGYCDKQTDLQRRSKNMNHQYY